MKRKRDSYKYLLFFTLNFLGTAYYCSAQVVDSLFNKMDTIKTRDKKYAPAFDLDQRFSFIRDQSVNIWGYREGVIINGKFKTGIGEYFLLDKLKSKKLDVNGEPLTYGKRSLIFGTVYFEPFLWRKKYWEMSIPIELGFGRSYFKVYDTQTNTFMGSTTTYFIPSGGGLSLSFKLPAVLGWRPTRWVGINFLAGYRYDFLERYFGTNYDGAYWSISGAIFLDRIQDDIRYWKKKKDDRNKSIQPQNL